jgi:hypothetical protein
LYLLLRYALARQLLCAVALRHSLKTVKIKTNRSAAATIVVTAITYFYSLAARKAQNGVRGAPNFHI